MSELSPYFDCIYPVDYNKDNSVEEKLIQQIESDRYMTEDLIGIVKFLYHFHLLFLIIIKKKFNS